MSDSSDDAFTKRYSFLFGMTVLEAWPLVPHVAHIAHFLFIVAPFWKHTPNIAITIAIFQSIMYGLCFFALVFESSLSMEFDPTFGFRTIAGAFREPLIVLGGFFHFGCYDILVSRWMIMDAIGHDNYDRWIHCLAMFPCLILGFTYGPVGWVVYLGVVRQFLLTTKKVKND